ncbi:MAG: DUF1697 domain-containing protein [Bacteroidales bacterium]|nr:MAG: DUF1697 domain-containing protein [Bacteroidales bacterium]
MKPAINSQYLALLRGINVGGNNIIKMADLKACFESMGFANVITYIQSGNVLFKSAEQDKAKLTVDIENKLSNSFNYQSKIVLVTHEQLHVVVKDAPNGFGLNPDEYRYDVLFLKEPLTSSEAIKSVKARDGVDSAYTGNDVLYFSRLISKAGKSYLTKIISLPIYKNMTIRNWNTTTKLLELMKQ